MSNTLGITINLTGVVGSGRTTASFSKTDYSVGPAMIIDNQTVTDSPAAIAVPAAIGDLGVLQIRNTGIEPVYLGTNAGAYPIVLTAAPTVGGKGGMAMFEVAVGSTIYAKTLASTSTVEVIMVERVATTTTTTTTTTTGA